MKSGGGASLGEQEGTHNLTVMMKGYDEATAFLGEWRRFQQLVFFLLCAAMVPNGLIVFAVVFAADIPEHRCLVPEVNLSKEWRDAIIPAEVTHSVSPLLLYNKDHFSTRALKSGKWRECE